MLMQRLDNGGDVVYDIVPWQKRQGGHRCIVECLTFREDCGIILLEMRIRMETLILERRTHKATALIGWEE